METEYSGAFSSQSGCSLVEFTAEVKVSILELKLKLELVII